MTESRNKADRQRRFALAYWAIAAGIIAGLNVDGSRFMLSVIVVGVAAGFYAAGEVVALLLRRHRAGHGPRPP